MGCWGVIRHIFAPVRIANAMNSKKAFAPRPAKIRITV
ncbi:glycoside hydrolase family 19 protein, partial [Salmonella enterica subsp. enterica]|nr:glycoside hydrolase family 19 protein [Salmonella enterica subsp. enterica]